MARDLDHGAPRHPQVEQGDVGRELVDPLGRLTAVPRAAGHLDAVRLEDAGDRLDDRRVVVGDDACRSALHDRVLRPSPQLKRALPR